MTQENGKGRFAYLLEKNAKEPRLGLIDVLARKIVAGASQDTLFMQHSLSLGESILLTHAVGELRK